MDLYCFMEWKEKEGGSGGMGNVIIVLGIVLLTVLMESWRENHVFRTTYYNIQSSKLQKLKKETEGCCAK